MYDILVVIIRVSRLLVNINAWYLVNISVWHEIYYNISARY
jgi:hypothetical protein